MNCLECNGVNLEFWIVEVEGEVLCIGCFELVLGIEFVGLWGGGIVLEWCGKGFYCVLIVVCVCLVLNWGVCYL